MCVWGCLDKYISATTYPLKQKFLTRPWPTSSNPVGYGVSCRYLEFVATQEYIALVSNNFSLCN